ASIRRRSVIPRAMERPLKVLCWVAAQIPSSDSPDSSAPSRCGRISAAKSAIDENPRVQDARRVNCPLGAAQCLGERLRALPVVPRTVVAADRVVMRDRSTGLDYGI